MARRVMHPNSLAAFRHNALAGGIAMAMQQVRAVMNVPTATPEAQELAAYIFHDLHKLSQMLKTRRSFDAPN
jgi:hypothetical protein